MDFVNGVIVGFAIGLAVGVFVTVFIASTYYERRDRFQRDLDHSIRTKGNNRP
jgi:hypothetical protein